jgi:hypothetical protein
MAKRFNVSIPDALAERLEPHKDRISLSAVMQAALERELAQLNLSDEDKQRRASLKAVATEAWLRRNPFIGEHLSAFIDHLLDQAINDGIDSLFGYYRQLSIAFRKEELATKMVSDFRYRRYMNCEEKSLEHQAMSALNYAHELYSAGIDGFDVFDEGFTRYLLDKAIRKEINLPAHLLEWEVDDPDYGSEDLWDLFTEEFHGLIDSCATQKLALSIMDSKLRAMLSEEDIDSFVLDFEAAFAKTEVEDWNLKMESK